MGHRPGEMAQTVKCLLFEHEDPRASSQNPQEELADQCVPLIPGLSGGDRLILAACLPASLPKLACFELSKKTLPQKLRWKVSEEDSQH